VSIRIYGNRAIKTLPGLDCRPTSARVRQALFNVWQGQIQDCRWLDLCTGSGAMAAEALCRGASVVLGIEESPIASKLIRENCQKLVTGDIHFRLINGRVQKFLPTLVGQQFDRIYCDPPYQSNLYQRILSAIEEHQLLAPYGEIALEHGRDRDLSQELTTQSLEVCRQKVYGSIALTFYAHQQQTPSAIDGDSSLEQYLDLK
jgi:16S rRNA (guanine966-N2)-methyltransferase